MNKKIIAILLIASLAIAEIFASYNSPTVILEAAQDQIDYTFRVQKLNAAMNGYANLGVGHVEQVTLSETAAKTNAFTISTIKNGNMPIDIRFRAVVATGEFINKEDASVISGWYPVIEDFSASATIENYIRGNETVIFIAGNNGDFRAASTGTYETIFTRGRHLYGTEIARFKLQYKADDNLAAGTYRSTTTITISTF
jgi:hypothetical protein